MLKALCGKAKTRAKKAGQKLKDLWGNIKKYLRKSVSEINALPEIPLFFLERV